VPPKFSLSENFGGGGRIRTGVLEQSHKSRYMLSLSFTLNLAHSAKQDYASRSPSCSRPAIKGQYGKTSLLPALNQATGEPK